MVNQYKSKNNKKTLIFSHDFSVEQENANQFVLISKLFNNYRNLIASLYQNSNRERKRRNQQINITKQIDLLSCVRINFQK